MVVSGPSAEIKSWKEDTPLFRHLLTRGVIESPHNVRYFFRLTASE